MIMCETGPNLVVVVIFETCLVHSTSRPLSLAKVVTSPKILDLYGKALKFQMREILANLSLEKK